MEDKAAEEREENESNPVLEHTKGKKPLAREKKFEAAKFEMTRQSVFDLAFSFSRYVY